MRDRTECGASDARGNRCTQGKSDLQRSKLYGKIGKQIAQAARAGGADPVANGRLKELMDVARAAQVGAPLHHRQTE